MNRTLWIGALAVLTCGGCATKDVTDSTDRAVAVPRANGGDGGDGGDSCNIDGRIDSTDLGEDTGNVCGERASSNWKGPACWDYHAVAGDGVHDIIDAEWNTLGSDVSDSGEQIPFVAHVRGNVDVTSIASQAYAFQGSVSPTKVGSGHNLTCAAFQGGSSGCDFNYSFQGNNGTLYNAEDLHIGTTALIEGDSTLAGNANRFGNTTAGALNEMVSETQFDRQITVDPSGAGVHIQVGALGVATNPVGVDSAQYESFAPNGGQHFMLLNNTLSGKKGWSVYHATNGTNDDYKFYNYNIGDDAMIVRGADSSTEFTAGVSAATIRTGGRSGPIWQSGAGVPTVPCVNGDLFSRTDGDVSTTLYVCTSPNTWTAK